MLKYFLVLGLLTFLITSYLFDPTGEFFSLKYISTIVVSLIIFPLYLFNSNKFKFNNVQLFYFYVFCLLMPIFGVVSTFLNSGLNEIIDTSYIGFSFMLFSLYPIILFNKEYFFSALIITLRILTVLILLILISLIYNGDELGISQFFIDHKSMLRGFREYGGITTYYLYFTASPLLILLLVYDAFKFIENKSFSRFLLFSFTSTAIFLSGTRYNMLVAIFIFPIIYLFKTFTLKKIAQIFFVFIGIASVLLYNSFITSFFDSKDASNSVKASYFSGYLEIFNNFLSLIFGQGFNAIDSSITFKYMLLKSGNDGAKTELTYIENFRVFGILFGSIINILIIFIPFFLWRKSQKIDFLVVGAGLYILSASINPYIFSTNGVILFLLMLSSFNLNNTSFQQNISHG